MQDQAEAIAINNLLADAQKALSGVHALATTKRETPDGRVAVILDIPRDSPATLDNIAFALSEAGLKLASIADPSREVDVYVAAAAAESLEIVRAQDPTVG